MQRIVCCSDWLCDFLSLSLPFAGDILCWTDRVTSTPALVTRIAVCSLFYFVTEIYLWPYNEDNAFVYFQISSFAPDLAKTIAGLILSSNDLHFQKECFSILGLQSQEIGTDIVVNCIEERIVSVIEMNDKDPQKSKEAPTLFGDENMQQVEFQENDDEEREYDFISLDL